MNANLHEKRQVHILALGRCALGLLVPAPGLQVDTLQRSFAKTVRRHRTFPEKSHKKEMSRPKTLTQSSIAILAYKDCFLTSKRCGIW